MNGATNVASFLLNKGMNPNKFDTSGNSDLHYSCAYGWYYCAKVLVESGADLNAANEWKLTPVTVAMLKGHSSNSNYLLNISGVDLNVKNDRGYTVLMSMLSKVSAEMPLTPHFLSEIKDMVSKRSADPKQTDNVGKNALHIVCSHNAVPNEQNYNPSARERAALKEI
jgi:ankyrin repeat protein